VIYPLVYNAHPSSYRVVRQPVYQRNTQNVHHLNTVQTQQNIVQLSLKFLPETPLN
jgi:hypothetical protein